MDLSFYSYILLKKIHLCCSVARSPKSLIWRGKPEGRAALGPGSEGNELGCFSSTLIFLRARSACASRAIGALLSSYSSLDGSDGLRRSFPTKIERLTRPRDVDSFSAPNEMGNL